MPAAARVEVDVDGRRLSLSNLDKILYPAVGFTKGQVIDYYTRVAPVLIPHLRDRPLTLKRYPNGVDGKFFYEKNCPSHRPDWVRTEAIWSRRNKAHINFCVVDELPTLVWAANLADLELHTSLSLATKIKQPRSMAFDLDPGAPATIVECAQVALRLRELFETLGLQSFPKTSGSKGMQLYVPLNVDGVTYDHTKPFAKGIAQMLEKEQPRLVVSQMKKELRGGKVFIDWSQNDEHKTTVNVYSLRAKQQPTVSTPLLWEEVEEIVEREDPDWPVFTSDDALARVDDHGDLFEPVIELEQELPELPDTARPRAKRR